MKRYAFIDLCKPALIIESDQLLTQDEVDVLLEKINYGLLTPNESRALILDRGLHIRKGANDSM